MNKFIITLTILLGSFSLTASAQQPSVSDLNNDARGMSPATYFELSQEADQLYSQRNYAKAAEAYEKLTKAYPLDGLKWRRLGFSYYQAGQYRDAIQPLMKAHELGHPIGRDYTAFLLAQSFARAGDTDNALIWVDKLLNQYAFPGKPYLPGNPSFESLKNNPRFLELTGSLPKKNFSRNQGWRYDLDYLMSEIKRVNPVYRKQPLPADLVQVANRLKAQIPKLSDAEIYFEMQHLLVLLRQSHNGLLSFLAGERVNLKQLPLTFYAFPEGLYIVAADKPYEDLIGSRVLLFDNTPAQRALEATGYLVGRENDMQILWNGPGSLQIMQFLHALKITDQPDSVNLTIVDRAGKQRVVSPAPMAAKEGDKLLAPRLENLPAPPLYLRRPNDNYWFEYLPDDKTLYLEFNQVVNNQEESIGQFGFRLREFLAQNEVHNLIVDVRRNNGGTTDLYPELLRTLIDFDIAHDKKLFVIIGRNTFSATGNFITDLSRLSNAVFVGEPSGGKPLLIGGDESAFTLPYSGAKGNLSSISWALTNPRDSRPWVTPDIPVQLTAKDYFANRDTVMETLMPLLRQGTKK